MWFKNLQLYRLPVPWNIDLSALDEQLARGEFTRCPSNQPMSRGWMNCHGEDIGTIAAINAGKAAIASVKGGS